MPEYAGILGWPVEHSISPAMHQAAFEYLGLDWRYVRIPAPPDKLPEIIAEKLAEGYRGFNVTIPHKQAVLDLPIVSDHGPEVGAIGAANTLSIRTDGTLMAHNTDWQGFAGDLAAQNIKVSGVTCLILGTGGSALAVAYALRQLEAAQVLFVSRHVGGRPDTIPYADIPGHLDAVRLVVNCTPVGMAPRSEDSPWPAHIPFPLHAALYDLIYTPPVTALMMHAQATGVASTSNGLGMLIRQGSAAFRIWTGREPPFPVMEQAARAALSLPQ